ncbi:PREDICTED: ankyrin repeat-containing protein At5g02620-like isoform X3 [Populus euphratica]|uniref:Ankyrin repeat-containing protein At5g02620-like isoform X3 n=1 Tax=Populus euphratica TaxID=75702 RepID=A0AAJ6VFI2_POPEU|nr:PREDICTED: ankyrin repeat-containing protein At5g02620-like isoform X3 [Populus euphratica]
MNSSDQQMNSITYMETELYKAAEAGNINPFNDRLPTSLNELLTPKKNSILHVYLEHQRRESESTDFVGQIIDMCPQLLLQANTKGKTPLHLAARYGHSNAVKVLIDRAKNLGIDPENGPAEEKKMLRMTNEEKDTALHVAARNIQAQVVEILTKEDPEFSYSANVHGETPLYIAANMRFYGKFKRHEENRKKVIDEILSNCESVEYSGSHGRTALHASAMHGDHETARKILERDASLTRRTDDNGWSPLHYAAFFPLSTSFLTVILLLKHDVSAAYIVDSEKRTALHLAVVRGNIAAMRTIAITCPACCELVDSRGWNALHYAATTLKGALTAMFFPRLIPKFDVLIYEKDNDGNTPLHLLAALGNFRQRYLSSDCRHAYKKMCGLNKQNLSVDDILGRNFPEEKKKILESLKNVRSGPLQRPITMMKEEDLSITERGIEAHIVVAALVATVTFAAAFTMPGGYKNEQGTAVLIKNAAFAVFVISDAIAMVLSTSAIFMHFYWALLGKRGQVEEDIKEKFSDWTSTLIICAIPAMVIAFITGSYALLAPSLWLAITICFIGVAFIFFACKAYIVPLRIILNY